MLKVDGHPVFEIITHKDIIVEKIITGLEVSGLVPVYKDLNYEAFIGMAEIKFKRGKVYADIHLMADIKGYPAVAFKTHNNNIYALGICAKPNVDKTIKSI